MSLPSRNSHILRWCSNQKYLLIIPTVSTPTLTVIVAHRLMHATAVCNPHSNYYACSQRTVTQLSNYLIIPDFSLSMYSSH